MNAEDKDGVTALSVASEKGNTEVMDELVVKHRNVVVTVGSDDGMTILTVSSDDGAMAIDVNSRKRRWLVRLSLTKLL